MFVDVKMYKSNKDRLKEEQRYNLRALTKLQIPKDDNQSENQQTHPVFDATRQYKEMLTAKIKKGSKVLEIGCGTGENTKPLIDSNCQLYLLDISEISLDVCRLKWGDRAKYVKANMESLPFESGFFDVVVSAGSLSYGDPQVVDSELFRVLKSGGSIILVDSLNHNPLYILNRIRHFLFKERSFSTIRRIPRVSRLKKYQKSLEKFEVVYFGTYLWVYTVLSPLIGKSRALRVYKYLEKKFSASRFAFKFTISGNKY